MKSLTRDDKDARDELVKRFTIAKTELSAVITEANSIIEQHRASIEAAQQKYNDVLGEAEVLRDEIREAIEDYIADRSEKWQEGERAEAYAAWRDAFDSLDTSELDIDLPGEIEDPEPDHCETLEQWPDSPDDV